MYKLTETKKQTLKEFVKENLRLKKIRLLQLSAGYPVLFIPKKVESLGYVLTTDN